MKKLNLFVILLTMCASLGLFIAPEQAHSQVQYKTETVDGIDIFYREAGDPTKQAVVLLHGFPSSSRQYRAPIAALGDEFYVIAPDYPGFGYSGKPTIEEYVYTFDNLAAAMTKFLEQKAIDNYFMMIHDYGAPVGFRMATQNPDRVAGFIVMNGNAYKEGLSEVSAQTLAQKRTPEDEKHKIAGFMSLGGIKWMYTTGAQNPESLNPDGWHLDHAIIDKPHIIALNLELLYDYPNNLPLYATWQEYMRETQPPMLIVWGKNDPIFTESGAAAYKRDVKDIDYNIYDTGHFPLEEHAPDIIEKMRSFLRRHSSADK